MRGLLGRRDGGVYFAVTDYVEEAWHNEGWSGRFCGGWLISDRGS